MVNRMEWLSTEVLSNEKTMETKWLNIIMALYQHAALSAEMVQRMTEPEDLTTTKQILTMMDEARLVNYWDDINWDDGESSSKARYYFLTKKGLRIVYLILRKNDKDLDESYFGMNEVIIEPKKNHAQLQYWIEILQQQCIKANLIIPHCEPQRYFRGDERFYRKHKPGWVLFNPDQNYSDALLNRRFDEIPSFFPYFLRENREWNMNLEPSVMLEYVKYDLKNENKLTILDNQKVHVAKCLVVFTCTKELWIKNNCFPLNDSEILLSMVSVRDFVRSKLERTLVWDVLQVIQGSELQTVAACQNYLEEYGTMLHKELINWDVFSVDPRYSLNDEEQLCELLGASEKLYKPFIDSFLLYTKEGMNQEVQFINYTRVGWLNPYEKLRRIKSNMKDYNTIKKKFILAYPNRGEMMIDIVETGTDIYYIAVDEINESGWGEAYQFFTNGFRVKWEKVKL